MEVAPTLIGARLVMDTGTTNEVEAVLVEVEAYLGGDDPASHAHRGPTPRTTVMFAEPGHLYVYLSYGIHRCANIVCEPAGIAGAILLRSAAVTRGESVVRRRRQSESTILPSAALLRGPGNLGAGLELRLEDNGLDVCHPRGRCRVLPALERPDIVIGPRVGISRGLDRPLRFSWAGHAALSSTRVR